MVFHAAVNASGGLLPIDDSSTGLQLAGQAVLTGCALALAAVLVRRHGVNLSGPLPAPHGLPVGNPPRSSATPATTADSQPMLTDTAKTDTVPTETSSTGLPGIDVAEAAPGRLRRWCRAVGQVLAGLLVLALVAGVVQAALERRDAGAHPAPG